MIWKTPSSPELPGSRAEPVLGFGPGSTWRDRVAFILVLIPLNNGKSLVTLADGRFSGQADGEAKTLQAVEICRLSEMLR